MIHAFIRHTRLTSEAPQPIVGTGLGWVVPMAFILGVALTVVGSHAL